jgi:putative oxidoreductase
MTTLLASDGGYAALIIRLALGGVMLGHGMMMTLGWFGGPGLMASARQLRDHGGLPLPIGWFFTLVEFLGALGLIVGLLTRVAALGIAAIMVGATVIHWPSGFFMNWFGQKNGEEGYEYCLLGLAMAASLILTGAGAFSIDELLLRVFAGR